MGTQIGYVLETNESVL